MFSAWQWQPAITAAASPLAVAGVVAGYLAVVWLLSALIKTPVHVPKAVIVAHNLVLCLGSLVMFLGAAYEALWEVQLQQSAAWLICLPKGTQMQGGLYFWSYVYYLSKFYEFLDTILNVLKAKKLTFLHVFHHATVVPMAWLWLHSAQSLQTVALLTNTFVHVVMYYYYYRSSVGSPPRWKQVVTNIQILQFVFSFLVSVPLVRQQLRAGKGWLGGDCSGFDAWTFNAVFNGVLLLLFINFHAQSYRNRVSRKKTS